MEESVEEDFPCKPKYDMEFDSEQDAYDFYNGYARIKGFSIRRDALATNKFNKMTSRTFVCCKQGIRKKDKRDDCTKNPRDETRTGCGAHMGIKLVRLKDKYCVYRFSEEHNHVLVPKDYVHLLPSQRKVAASDNVFLYLTASSGVPPKAAFDLMGKQAGGRESLGFTKQDQRNYLRTVRQKKMKFGEATYLTEYFAKQMLENPSFYYEMQLDNEEMITNIFWADAKMIMNYGMFGDVVSFDTTYKINKANRPFAVFVGLNHHRQTVIFGAALMYDETAASFTWLFETFLKAMCGKPPQTIFTDQDAAIAKAVLNVMPETYHRLCVWHLMQNAVKKVGFLFGKLTGDADGAETGDADEAESSYVDGAETGGAHVDGNPNHGNVFNKFLYQIEEENEFLLAWESMLDKNNAHDNTWLAATFAIRKKWVHAYVKWTWSAGMQSTQLSESINATLKGYLKSDVQLPDFFIHYERMVYEKREKEKDAEYAILFRIVHCKVEAAILTYAREVYTKRIFKEFQAQFEASLKFSITNCVSDGHNYIFTVVRDGFNKERLVKREGESTVSCSCRMFEIECVLCRHAIKVMLEGREAKLIKNIPQLYILKRWTKHARVNNFVKDIHGHKIIEDPRLKQNSRNRILCSKLVQLASKASESEKAYELAITETDKLSKMVEDMLRVEINGDEDLELQDQNVLVDRFNTVIAKGFKKREATHRGKRRAKGDFEAKISKSKKRPAQVAKVSKHSATLDQSTVPSIHQSQVHDLNMSSQMSWMPSQESSRPSSQVFVQSNIMGFPGISNCDED